MILTGINSLQIIFLIHRVIYHCVYNDSLYFYSRRCFVFTWQTTTMLNENMFSLTHLFRRVSFKCTCLNVLDLQAFEILEVLDFKLLVEIPNNCSKCQTNNSNWNSKQLRYLFSWFLWLLEKNKKML